MLAAVKAVLELLAIGTGLYAAHLCVILVHEAGHALAAQMLGSQCNRIIVGPFNFDRKDGFSVRLRWNEFLTGSVHYQFRSVPGVGAAARAFGVYFAGPLFSLLFSILASDFTPSKGATSELVGVAVFDSALIGVLSLIPARKGIRTTDGHKMWSLIFSVKRRRRLLFLLSIQARIDELKQRCKGESFPALLKATNELIHQTEEIPELRSETKWMTLLLKIQARAIEGISNHTGSQDVVSESS